MNKKSKRKNDLRSSIVLLLILLLLLISSTYAWFTANQTVKISSLDVNIAAENGLQISTDATTWKAIISNDDIINAYEGNPNIIPTKIVPVSTVGEIDSSTGYMKMFLGTVGADDAGVYKLTADQSAENSGNFIAFDIYLKVDENTDLKLTTNSGVVKKGESDSGIKQASRIAFCVQGNSPSGTAPDTVKALKNAVSFGDASSTVYIWEPNADLHTDAAVGHARDTYGITTDATNDAAVLTYNAIKADIETGVELDSSDANYFNSMTPTYQTKSTAEGVMEAEQQIFSLKAGVTKVRVYMWIEGQDVDCENTASGTDISYNIEMQVIPKVQQPAG